MCDWSSRQNESFVTVKHHSSYISISSTAVLNMHHSINMEVAEFGPILILDLADAESTTYLHADN